MTESEEKTAKKVLTIVDEYCTNKGIVIFTANQLLKIVKRRWK